MPNDSNRNARNRKLRVFVCHASADKSVVRTISTRLREAGFDPWLDEDKLLPGQVWEATVEKAIRESDVVIVCLSQYAVSEAGFRHKEIRLALDVAEEQPEENIFIVPLKLEECKIPNRLKHLHCSSLTDQNGFNKLIESLSERARSKGLPPVSPRPILVLYAVRPWISHVVGEEYFEGFQHVRCTTANVQSVYADLLRAVKAKDRRDPMIRTHSEELIRDAWERVGTGELDKKRYKIITDIIALAEARDFKPLLYIIPFASVESVASVVPSEQRKNLLGGEYIIRRLPRHLFDLLDLE